jgi:hypothetical protein
MSSSAWKMRSAPDSTDSHVGADGHLGGGRRLVRLGDADEVRNLSGEGLLVLARRVPLDELLGRAVDVDLEIPADETAVVLARAPL